MKGIRVWKNINQNQKIYWVASLSTKQKDETYLTYKLYVQFSNGNEPQMVDINKYIDIVPTSIGFGVYLDKKGETRPKLWINEWKEANPDQDKKYEDRYERAPDDFPKEITEDDLPF